jgi:hypothetical protein
MMFLVILTGEEHVNLTLKVANRNEPAYEANVFISHPASLSFVGRKVVVSILRLVHVYSTDFPELFRTILIPRLHQQNE